MPRQAAVGRPRTRPRASLGGRVALGPHGARVLVLDARCARLPAGARVRRMPSSMSSGSKPVTTIGTRYCSPAARTPRAHDVHDVAGGRESPARGCSATPGSPRSPAAPARATPAARSSRSPRRLAWQTAIALAGAVVSKPMAKNTTCLSGFSARSSARRAASTRRARRRPALLTGTGPSRCPGRAACRRTSRRSLGPRGDRERLVDHLQRRHAHRAARPVDQLDLAGSSSSMPYRTIVCVCPPQTSMIVQGRVIVRGSRRSAGRQLGIAELVEVLHVVRPSRTACVPSGRGSPPRRPRDPSGRRTPCPARPIRWNSAQRLLRRCLVKALQGETHMDHGVVADDDLRRVLEAHVLHDTAEVHLRHPGVVAVLDTRRIFPGTARHMSSPPFPCYPRKSSRP